MSVIMAQEEVCLSVLLGNGRGIERLQRSLFYTGPLVGVECVI